MPTRSGRLICWWKEFTLAGALLVVEQRKVALLQVGNVVPMLVGHREDEVDFIDAQLDGGRVHIATCVGSWRVPPGCVRPGFARRWPACGAAGLLVVAPRSAKRTANAAASTRPRNISVHSFFILPIAPARSHLSYLSLPACRVSAAVRAFQPLQKLSSSAGSGASSSSSLPVLGCVNSSRAACRKFRPSLQPFRLRLPPRRL